MCTSVTLPGRIRLTDFGAATPCLPGRPGCFGGVAGTRAYLAPEMLPWLAERERAERERSGGSGRGASGGGPEPYSATVDSWGWGLLMLELATGWPLRELNARVVRRVCAAKARDVLPVDLPEDCGLPPSLRQLLVEHVLVRRPGLGGTWPALAFCASGGLRGPASCSTGLLCVYLLQVRDPAARWPASRIRSHAFFSEVNWAALAEAAGPHAHLFSSRRDEAIEKEPADLAAVVLASEPHAAAARLPSSNGRAGTGPWTRPPSPGEPGGAGASLRPRLSSSGGQQLPSGASPAQSSGSAAPTWQRKSSSGLASPVHPSRSSSGVPSLLIGPVVAGAATAPKPRAAPMSRLGSGGGNI
jgi:hypothetical protein